MSCDKQSTYCCLQQQVIQLISEYLLALDIAITVDDSNSPIFQQQIKTILTRVTPDLVIISDGQVFIGTNVLLDNINNKNQSLVAMTTKILSSRLICADDDQVVINVLTRVTEHDKTRNIYLIRDATFKLIKCDCCNGYRITTVDITTLDTITCP